LLAKTAAVVEVGFAGDSEVPEHIVEGEAHTVGVFRPINAPRKDFAAE
jgi:hypothetical protein